MNLRRDVEVVDEVLEHLRICPRPRIDGLLVIANGEHVTMVACECLDDPVLHRVEILKFVHEHDVPSRPQLCRGPARALEQLGRLDDQRVEIHQLPIGEKALVLVKEHEIVVLKRIAAKPMGGEPREHAAVPFARAFDAPQHIELVLLVGDAKARLEKHGGAEFAKELRAERVDGSAFDLLGRRAEPRLEPVGDLAGGLVGEREGADAIGLESFVLDQIPDALDEAEGLARARAREDEHRMRRGLDGAPLGGRRVGDCGSQVYRYGGHDAEVCADVHSSQARVTLPVPTKAWQSNLRSDGRRRDQVLSWSPARMVACRRPPTLFLRASSRLRNTIGSTSPAAAVRLRRAARTPFVRNRCAPNACISCNCTRSVA